MYNKEYTITPDAIDLLTLIEQCDVADMPNPLEIAFSKDGTKITLYFETTLTTEQITTLDNVITSQDPLQALKNKRKKEVDHRTTEIVNEGFTFADIVFNGEPESQSRIIGAFLAKDFATYPIKWMSKDDSTYIEITDATMMSSFFLTGFGTLKYKIDLGSDLKIAIQAATTTEAVNSITDPR